MLFALVAVAGEPSVEGEKWQVSAESYFMTAEERLEWKRVTTDDDAQRFIAAFHARRHRDFAADIRTRTAIVDERLALGDARASTTLRGRIAILLGAPAELRVRAIRSPGRNFGHPLQGRMGDAGSGQPRGASVVITGAGWVEYTFHYLPNPALGIGPEGWTVVIEANGASGKDRLKYKRDRKKMEPILDAAARNSVHQH
jgi:hypothetical protein